MLFNSFEFAEFFALIFAGYLSLPHRSQNALLLAGSYVFYGWWDWRVLSLLWISTVVDYAVGRALDGMATGPRRRVLIVVSLGANLGLLGFFKYFYYFAVSASAALQQIGVQASAPLLKVVLPVGISFYTFQSISYVVDVYRRNIPAVQSLTLYALLMAYFPQLVAGPIERSMSLMPQLDRPRVITVQAVRTALPLILRGYFKKVFIADSLAVSHLASPRSC